MGLELLIWGLWVIQGIVGLAMAMHAAFSWRWFAAAGTIVGLAIGISPFYLMQGQGPAVWGPAISIVLFSTVALALAFGVTMRWKALIATLLLLIVPLAYRLFAYERFPPSSNAFFRTLALFAETAFFCGPIICALASRQIFGWLDRFVPTRRTA